MVGNRKGKAKISQKDLKSYFSQGSSGSSRQPSTHGSGVAAAEVLEELQDNVLVVEEEVVEQEVQEGEPFRVRNKMTEGWLNDLMVCYIEREIFKGLDLQEIKKAFQKKKGRQMQLPRSPRRN